MSAAADPATTALAERLCATARFCAGRGLCPATGGNFSARIDEHNVLITASGLDKAALMPVDLLVIGVDGTPMSDGRPSAETGLHLALYRHDPAIGAVLHTHSVANTLLSRLDTSPRLDFEGYEMQKSIAGNETHAATLTLPVFDNSQDMAVLAEVAQRRFEECRAAHGFLVRGHGIYAWGSDLTSARRHLEGWEFLLACELQRRQLENRG